MKWSATLVILLAVFYCCSLVELVSGQGEINQSNDANATSPTPVPMANVTSLPPPVCPSNVECSRLGAACIECSYNESCRYGESMEATCFSNTSDCTGPQTFTRNVTCRFCYQLEPSDYTCENSTNCVVAKTPRPTYQAKCKARENVVCLGSRRFLKKRRCNWTSGYRWSTALALSVTLGGFGVDRFYLGDWRNGLGKLFSFGGLGVWTLIDILLVAVGYLSPSDGSLYIT